MAPVIPAAHQRRGKRTRGRETGGKEEDQREREREEKRKEKRKEKSWCVSKLVSTRASLLPIDKSRSALQPPLGTSPALPCLPCASHVLVFPPGQL